jgi:hypothetical protein
MKKNIIKIQSDMLHNNIIPNSFDYSIDYFNITDIEIDLMHVDINKVSYNSYYNSFDFYSKKFPIGWDSIPGFGLVIQEMANKSLSPLEEMIERNNIKSK